MISVNEYQEKRAVAVWPVPFFKNEEKKGLQVNKAEISEMENRRDSV